MTAQRLKASPTPVGTPCIDCLRPMVPCRQYQSKRAEWVAAGHVRVGAHGRCAVCADRVRRWNRRLSTSPSVQVRKPPRIDTIARIYRTRTSQGWSRALIAAHLGMTRRALNRALVRARDAGLLPSVQPTLPPDEVVRLRRQVGLPDVLSPGRVA